MPQHEVLNPYARRKLDVYVSDVTPEELAESQLPDTSFRSAWIRFTSSQGVEYKMAHVHNDYGSERILLESVNKNQTLFRDVESTLVALINRRYPQLQATPEKDQIYDRTDDICHVIHLSAPLSQEIVGQLAAAYAEKFQQVNIDVVFYHDVPGSLFDPKVGIPPGKFTITK